MKRFAALLLSSSILFTNPIQAMCKNQIENIEIQSFEDQNPVETEDFKKIYLKIIENLSFRNTLWEQSTNFIKIENKNDVASLWGNGIKNKNGTLLFLISNDNIKSQLKNLFRDNCSWFLENDKYIIESFKVSKPKKISKNIFTYEITYKSTHVDGYPQKSKQKISIEHKDGVSKICEFSNIINEQ